ncbi:MAG: ATP-binding protein [Halobacteriota archaeon]
MPQIKLLIDNFVIEQSCTSFEKILQHHTGEDGSRNRLDFKRVPPDYAKVAKHIHAMANCGGGIIVFGVDQKADGSFDPIGLLKFTNKADIQKKLKKNLSNELVLLYHVIDLDCKSLKQGLAAGKKFQVIIVKDDPLQIPHITQRDDGTAIVEGTIYVRRHSESVRANFAEVQNIIARNVSAKAQQEGQRQQQRSQDFATISPTEKRVLRLALYDEIVTTAEKIELIQFGACLVLTTDDANDYIRSNNKLQHIPSISFPVHTERLDPTSYVQLEDKKQIEDIYEDLKMDKNGLMVFSETPFDSVEQAMARISGLRQRFSQQTANRIGRLLESSELLLQSDSLTNLKKRWSKVSGNLSDRFHCSAQSDPFGPIATKVRQKGAAIKKKRERRLEFLKSVYDCMERSKNKVIFITKADPIYTYPLIKDYGFTEDEIGEFVEFFKNKGCLRAKPTWGTKIPLMLTLTDSGIEYVESLFLGERN